MRNEDLRTEKGGTSMMVAGSRSGGDSGNEGKEAGVGVRVERGEKN